MLFALVVVVTIGCSWWSWRYQKMVSGMLQAGPAEPELDHTTAAIQLDQIEHVDGPATSPVLTWDAFSIASVLRYDGTVLVSCTRSAEGAPEQGPRGGDGSLVLLIGDDEEAGRAFRLIEDWRASGTTLRLRPTTMACAIELYDRRDNALRADLLAI